MPKPAFFSSRFSKSMLVVEDDMILNCISSSLHEENKAHTMIKIKAICFMICNAQNFSYATGLVVDQLEYSSILFPAITN